jgi:biopolymer transport protein ExbB/TolQ
MKKNSNASRAFLFAAIASIVFYTLVHQPAMRHSILHTYTTEHITEYAIVILFFWANADLILSFLGTTRESSSVRYNWLPSRQGIEPVENAEALVFFVKAGPANMHETKMYRRVMAALSYIRERQSAVGFREYLQDLAGRDSDETFARYGFPRFVTGILPILGLLGTVVHFGGALSGLSTDDLASKVPQIVSGMGTAFNTTCAALTASTSTMLIRFLVERREESIVVQVNEYVEDQLLNRFVSSDSQLQPVLQAIFTTNGSTIQAIQTATQHLMTLTNELKHSRSLSLDVKEVIATEKQLLVLQDRLAQNLTLLHQSQHLDEAVHGLTAAMHLIMARQNEGGKNARAA